MVEESDTAVGVIAGDVTVCAYPPLRGVVKDAVQVSPPVPDTFISHVNIV